MSGRMELLGYLSVSVGMALAASCYAVIGGLLTMPNTADVVLAILVAGVFCAGVAASVSELASMYPSAPGVATYLRAAFGERGSLPMVFLYLCMVVLVAGVESYAFGYILSTLMPGVPVLLPVLGLLVLVTGINLFGLEFSRGVQVSLTVVLMLGMMTVSFYALATADSAPDQVARLPLEQEATGFLAAVGMAFFLFVGFEWVTPLGRSPAAYRRLIPASMLLSVGLLAAMYALFAAAVGVWIGSKEAASGPAPQMLLGAALFNHGGIGLMLLLSTLAMVSSFNAGLMGASRLIYSMARQGHLPAWCAKLSTRRSVPVGAVLLLGIASIVSATVITLLHAQMTAVVISAAIVTLTYAALMLSVLRLRKTAPQRSRPFRNWVPRYVQAGLALLIFLLGGASLATGESPSALPVFGVLALASLLLAWRHLPCADRLGPNGGLP